MIVERNPATRARAENDESGDIAEPIQTGEVVPYGHGVIRRRGERSPDTSDGEGQGKEVVKRTRRNPGREIVLRDDTAHEDDWRPVETGMVLRADGTVMRPDNLEGDTPHEGHNQASQPRRHWGVVVPSTSTNDVEGDTHQEDDNPVCLHSNSAVYMRLGAGPDI
ncbi:hypothetical protein V1508DRAFT_400646 [Lipomyces doorenjongii]|uniref:uncharacterized protein n=1 Tax=Lipomyces doorenjongii TaxID=383834 RepID=UPI0034CF0049